MLWSSLWEIFLIISVTINPNISSNFTNRHVSPHPHLPSLSTSCTFPPSPSRLPNGLLPPPPPTSLRQRSRRLPRGRHPRRRLRLRLRHLNLHAVLAPLRLLHHRRLLHGGHRKHTPLGPSLILVLVLVLVVVVVVAIPIAAAPAAAVDYRRRRARAACAGVAAE
ncbi:hypothetical protein EDC01DRAFT_132716 [Geopyxis carbonaria]|nr:hypothetical protein EDC01DRAFT_132716 [Geopyxis carbonaria]